jgi:hypothetical protein
MFLSGGVVVKKWMICVLIMLLSGCGAYGVPETVSDTLDFTVMPAAGILFDMPADASEAVFSTEEAGSLYLCDGYTLTVQTLPGGDLNRTLETVTGYEAQKLTVLELEREELSSYRTVWSCAGEGGDQLGRAMILGDGTYHYVLSVMAPAEEVPALTETWNALFDSFTVSRIAP